MSSSGDAGAARKYAKALFESAPGEQLDSYVSALSSFVDLWQKNKDFRLALTNPAHAMVEREQVVRDYAEMLRPNDKILANFITILLQNNRLSSLPMIRDRFVELVEEMRKILSFEATTAFVVSEQERVETQEKLKEIAPKTYSNLVSVKWHVDPSIIGGMKIKCAGKLLDNSVQGSLEKIGRTLRVS